MRLIDADALMSDIGSYSLEVEAHNHDSQLEKMRKVVQAVQDHSVQCIEIYRAKP